MDFKRTALILIGYQNDYFAEDGIVREVVEASLDVTHVLSNTVSLINRLAPTPMLMVATPIIFTRDYGELLNPIGILKTIKEAKAFRKNSEGSKTIPELLQFGDRIIEVPGKRGFNAFSNTDLDNLLQKNEITHVVIAGVVTSICIDSTARSAFERGYRVLILSDCTSGRSAFEQEYYCKSIFPMYAEVMDHSQLIKSLGIGA